MKKIDDSFLLRNLQDKEKIEETDKTINTINIIRPTALRLDKNYNNILKYNPYVNYYEEYWKMICENEYLMAQIKETMIEIGSMKAHIQQLSNQL